VSLLSPKERQLNEIEANFDFGFDLDFNFYNNPICIQRRFLNPRPSCYRDRDHDVTMNVNVTVTMTVTVNVTVKVTSTFFLKIHILFTEVLKFISIFLYHEEH
jgi:hypothetical protein